MQVNKNRLFERIESLALFSEKTKGVTRLPFTDESKAALDSLDKWMKEAGMTVRYDAMCNIIGHYPGEDESQPVIMIGSHVDTIIEGGKYDGALGILAGIEVIQTLNENNISLAVPVEVVGFCDEEGVRFGTTLLGSRAIAGTLPESVFDIEDINGISMKNALSSFGGDPDNYKDAKYDKGKIGSYLEIHIEQGPVLEELGKSCGIVTGIAGQSRYLFEINGYAGHAGTVPINMRQDALCAASELILSIERLAKQFDPLVATVGQLKVSPGASNVIPGSVLGSLDVRDLNSDNKNAYLDKLFSIAKEIAKKRDIKIDFESILEIPVTTFSDRIIELMRKVTLSEGEEPIFLQSGAGHDGMAISEIADIGMIFVRCKDGLSHHPDEYCSSKDMAAGAQLLLDVLLEMKSN